MSSKLFRRNCKLRRDVIAAKKTRPVIIHPAVELKADVSSITRRQKGIFRAVQNWLLRGKRASQ